MFGGVRVAIIVKNTTEVNNKRGKKHSKDSSFPYVCLYFAGCYEHDCWARPARVPVGGVDRQQQRPTTFPKHKQTHSPTIQQHTTSQQQKNTNHTQTYTDSSHRHAHIVYTNTCSAHTFPLLNCTMSASNHSYHHVHTHTRNCACPCLVLAYMLGAHAPWYCLCSYAAGWLYAFACAEGGGTPAPTTPA